MKKTSSLAPQITRIVVLLVTIVVVLSMRKGCAQGFDNLFRAIETPPPARPALDGESGKLKALDMAGPRG